MLKRKNNNMQKIKEKWSNFTWWFRFEKDDDLVDGANKSIVIGTSLGLGTGAIVWVVILLCRYIQTGSIFL